MPRAKLSPDAPKLGVSQGHNKVIVGHSGGGLDSWDIVHAMSEWSTIPLNSSIIILSPEIGLKQERD